MVEALLVDVAGFHHEAGTVADIEAELEDTHLTRHGKMGLCARGFGQCMIGDGKLP